MRLNIHDLQICRANNDVEFRVPQMSTSEFRRVPRLRSNDRRRGTQEDVHGDGEHTKEGRGCSDFRLHLPFLQKNGLFMFVLLGGCMGRWGGSS